MRRRILSSKSAGGINPSQSKAADICLYDGTTDSLIIVEGNDYNTSNYPTSRYTPIGVIVIPASHMPDGRARMMSLRWMNCNDPENGSLIEQSMVWGAATNLTGLTNFTEVPIIESATNQIISGVNNSGYLSSDQSGYAGTANPQDPGTKWHNDHKDSYIASPYASDGTPNPLYRATSYSGGSINNALSYFDGKHQTDVILEARGEKDYSSWKPDSDTPEDFPAASCCDMYHTVGTSQGDWYLPSQAELGYVVARLGAIEDTMEKVNSKRFITNEWVWTSSEYSSSNARHVFFYSGDIGNWYHKIMSSCVIAFCQV